ncbi:MAG: D-glycerate dehydrogenase [Chloroflexi bacterium]|nr:D-glycerate dehydrogenase [Chloroflexota bacterium]
MLRPRVFVTRRMAQEAIDLLSTELDVEVWPDDHAPPRDVLLKKTGECVALLTTVEDRIDEAVLAAGHGALKVVANCAVGFDNFDIQAATRLGVALSNTPGVLTKTTADLAFALILATARQVVQGDRDVRAGRWKSWHPFAYTGPDIHGATLGIIGLGQIGLEVARRAMGFEMTVLYYDPVRRPEAEETYGLTFCPDIPSALKEADFVSLHVPLTPDTRHMMGRDYLKLMKPTAILVNTARGAIVDHQALYEALRDGVIAGAGLDVTEPEPIPPDHPLLTLPNVVVTPHVGSASLQTRREMALLAARNILAALNGREMPTCLNPEVLDGS